MLTDQICRRTRVAPPQARAVSIEVTPDDLILFEAINRHGPLPTSILHRFVPHKNFNRFQHRLTKLYNGSNETKPLLVRPKEQFNSYRARYQHIAYDLSATAKSLLVERGVAVIQRTDPMIHRIMGSCVGASIELAAKEHGLRYISRAEILEKSKSVVSIDVAGRKLIPDDLFGLRYRTGAYRFFAMEIDRGTESLQASAAISTSIKRKYEMYLELLGREAHKFRWGVPALMVLFVTTSPAREANLRALLDATAPERSKNVFLFNTWEGFGACWHMPREPYPSLLLEPWRRSGEPFRIDRP